MSRSTTPGIRRGSIGLAGPSRRNDFFLATGAVAYFNFQTLKADSALVIHTVTR